MLLVLVYIVITVTITHSLNRDKVLIIISWFFLNKYLDFDEVVSFDLGLIYI